jgi:hypothetical protein
VKNRYLAIEYQIIRKTVALLGIGKTVAIRIEPRESTKSPSRVSATMYGVGAVWYGIVMSSKCRSEMAWSRSVMVSYRLLYYAAFKRLGLG